jgi:hypothetical protein
MPLMEENLAREMARMKMEKEKQSREIEKICAESPELRELQNKIKSAYLNKERASQVTETQYRKQVEVVSLYSIIILFYGEIRTTLISLHLMRLYSLN